MLTTLIFKHLLSDNSELVLRYVDSEYEDCTFLKPKKFMMNPKVTVTIKAYFYTLQMNIEL